MGVGFLTETTTQKHNDGFVDFVILFERRGGEGAVRYKFYSDYRKNCWISSFTSFGINRRVNLSRTCKYVTVTVAIYFSYIVGKLFQYSVPSETNKYVRPV